MIIAWLKEFFLNIIFPKDCLGCQKENIWLCQTCFNKIKILSGPFCIFCKNRLPPNSRCQKCNPRPKARFLFAAASYEMPLIKNLIKYYKYQKIKELAEPLSQLLIKSLDGVNLKNFKVVPVPLHQAKFRERSFNQAELLAKNLASHFNLEFCDILTRVKNTKSQTEFKGTDRLNNVLSTFKIKSPVEITGQKILLIDDVSTTGATLNECGKILKESGAREIWAIVVAK